MVIFEKKFLLAIVLTVACATGAQAMQQQAQADTQDTKENQEAAASSLKRASSAPLDASSSSLSGSSGLGNSANADLFVTAFEHLGTSQNPTGQDTEQQQAAAPTAPAVEENNEGEEEIEEVIEDDGKKEEDGSSADDESEDNSTPDSSADSSSTPSQPVVAHSPTGEHPVNPTPAITTNFDSNISEDEAEEKESKKEIVETAGSSSKSESVAQNNSQEKVTDDNNVAGGQKGKGRAKSGTEDTKKADTFSDIEFFMSSDSDTKSPVKGTTEYDKTNAAACAQGHADDQTHEDNKEATNDDGAAAATIYARSLLEDNTAERKEFTTNMGNVGRGQNREGGHANFVLLDPEEFNQKCLNFATGIIQACEKETSTQNLTDRLNSRAASLNDAMSSLGCMSYTPKTAIAKLNATCDLTRAIEHEITPCLDASCPKNPDIQAPYTQLLSLKAQSLVLEITASVEAIDIVRKEDRTRLENSIAANIQSLETIKTELQGNVAKNNNETTRQDAENANRAYQYAIHIVHACPETSHLVQAELAKEEVVANLENSAAGDNAVVEFSKPEIAEMATVLIRDAFLGLNSYVSNRYSADSVQAMLVKLGLNISRSVNGVFEILTNKKLNGNEGIGVSALTGAQVLIDAEVALKTACELFGLETLVGYLDINKAHNKIGKIKPLKSTDRLVNIFKQIAPALEGIAATTCAYSKFLKKTKFEPNTKDVVYYSMLLLSIVRTLDMYTSSNKGSVQEKAALVLVGSTVVAILADIYLSKKPTKKAVAVRKKEAATDGDWDRGGDDRVDGNHGRGGDDEGECCCHHEDKYFCDCSRQDNGNGETDEPLQRFDRRNASTTETVNFAISAGFGNRNTTE